MREVLRLQRAVAAQQTRERSACRDRNRQLAAEVRDLKQGFAALEERARNDLGMIGGNETFYQVVPRRRAVRRRAGSRPPDPSPRALRTGRDAESPCTTGW